MFNEIKVEFLGLWDFYNQLGFIKMVWNIFVGLSMRWAYIKVKMLVIHVQSNESQ